MESIRWADGAAQQTIMRASATVQIVAVKGRQAEAWEEELGIQRSEEQRKERHIASRKEKAEGLGIAYSG